MPRTRFSLDLPTYIHERLETIADREETTIADLLRRGAKLLFFVLSIRDEDNARLLVQRGDEIEEIALDFI